MFYRFMYILNLFVWLGFLLSCYSSDGNLQQVRYVTCAVVYELCILRMVLCNYQKSEEEALAIKQ